MGSENQISRRDLVLAALAGPIQAPTDGTVLLISVKDRRLGNVRAPDLARRWVVAPGSTIKPLTLLALLESNKLKSTDEFSCPGRLTLNGRSLNCSHPNIALPMNVSRAISYSCNCAVAHFAQRFEPDELSEFLIRFGFSSATGLLNAPEAAGFVGADLSGPACQLQALGEENIAITPLELLAAYRRLSMRVSEPQMTPILEGLEGAVQFGTAQGAQLSHIRVAGKTGTVQTRLGVHAAWFAGFAPSRAPEVAVVVLVQGRSGGGDAAPIGGKILREYFGTRA